MLAGGERCPWATAALPGLGGRLHLDAADFVVDEVPAYPPSGEGTHWFVRVRKTGLETREAQDLLAGAAGVDPRDVGFAGRKDKHAVATQWFSLPKTPVDPGDPRLEVLEIERHPHKLRVGHVKANRFCVRVRGVDAEAEARLPALEAHVRAGVPNYFGPQRFGHGGRALEDGLRLLRKARVRDPHFAASIVQSAVFNRWLGDRVAAGLLDTLVPGDVLKKRETGGLFRSTDAAADAPRLAAGEVDPTGPLPGPKGMAAGEAALASEQAALDALGLDEGALRQLARFAPGSRRVARLVPEGLSLRLEDGDLMAEFTLPSGSYATVVLGELCHGPADLRLYTE